MTDSQAAQLVGIHVPRLIRDAEALLTVAGWPDAPAGVAVLPLADRPDASGSSLGSGHTLAIAHGRRPGAVAVFVDAAGILRPALWAAPESPDYVIGVARQWVEAIAVHELAHAVVAEPDAVLTCDADAAARVAAALKLPPGIGADVHGPRWAAAVVVLTGRAIELRPAHERRGREDAARYDLSRYGFDADAIRDAVGPVAADASLRELLAADGAAARRVAAVCPPVAERQALIDIRRQQGAAGDGLEKTGGRHGQRVWVDAAG